MQFNKPAIILLSLIAISLVSGCNLVDRLGEEDPGSGEPNSGQDAGPDSNNGTIIIRPLTVPPGQVDSFTYTGVPTGTVATDSTLVVANLQPGTYTTTETNPAPNFDVTAVECDDGASASPSSGDPQTRTAIINLDAGETVMCAFTNSQRGSLVVTSRTEPEGSGGSFLFTGVPSGTIPANGTLVVANLQPGSYSSTEADPAPDFDVTAVECDDGGSRSSSSGDSGSRTAIFNLDPGELVTCTFTNTRRGTAIVTSQVEPDGATGSFQFTGVPTGTVLGDGTLVVSNLTPGTYTTTEVDPAPEFELTTVECDDGDSATPSDGEASTHTAIYNIDAGETVNCTFTNSLTSPGRTPTVVAGGATGQPGESGPGDGAGPIAPGSGTNPFEDPDEDFPNFPVPEELPPGAGSYYTPKPGPWSVTNFAGQMSCGGFNLEIPASPVESGVLDVLDGGQTIIGTGIDESGSSITLVANPGIRGRYTGSFQGQEQGVPVTIDYFWQVVTDEYIVGYLTSSVTVEGVSCNIYRAFEMVFTGG